METYSCVIVEDAQHTARLMEKYVSQVNQLSLLGVFVSPMELINFPEINNVDIIFLDIQTPGMTGIDFLKLNKIKAKVILTTAYTDFALEGYKLNVIDYVVKPIDFTNFVQATYKAIDQLNLERGKHEPVERIKEDLVFKVDKKLVRVLINDIVYIQSDWNYLHIHTLTDKMVILGTMKRIEEQLPKDGFIRIHKSYIINEKYFEFLEGNQIQVNGIKLQVGRNYKENVLNIFKPNI